MRLGPGRGAGPSGRARASQRRSARSAPPTIARAARSSQRSRSAGGGFGSRDRDPPPGEVWVTQPRSVSPRGVHDLDPVAPNRATVRTTLVPGR